MTRKEAILAGRKLYSNGVPCLRGHVGPRYVEGCRCRECSRIDARKYNTPRMEKYREKRLLARDRFFVIDQDFEDLR